MLKGSCLCGKVSYEYTGLVEEVVLCHCSQCRKAQGSIFAANAALDADQLTFYGQEFIQEYQSMPQKVRAFCRCCGSPLYSAHDDFPDVRRVRIGSLDTALEGVEVRHIHLDSKVEWLE